MGSAKGLKRESPELRRGLRDGGREQNDGMAFDRFPAESGVLILYRCRGCQINSYNVQPVVERGEDSRDYDWTCDSCE